MDSNTLKQRAKAFDYLFDAVVVTDAQGIITDWNKGSENLYGYSRNEVIGKPVSILHVPEDVQHITTKVLAAVEKHGKWSGEVRMLHKDGHIGWIESMCVPILDDSNKMVGALGINRDITSRMKKLEQLENLAHYDQLTKIPNRYLLLDRINHLISRSRRNKYSFALLYIDLDNFKDFNDTRGHAFGDQVLIEVVSRLEQTIRESDTIARMGGDEFVVLLENTSDKDEIAKIVDVLTNPENKPLKINNEEHAISCSIGVAIYPDDGVTTDALLAVADKAMYKCKQKLE
jgi:diguanylate cyclase (GGDEF)-like protein/PAS domain S-box-containing protein